MWESWEKPLERKQIHCESPYSFSLEEEWQEVKKKPLKKGDIESPAPVPVKTSNPSIKKEKTPKINNEIR